MPISYLVHSYDENPYQISGEVLFPHYFEKDSKLKNIEATNNRLTLDFEGEGHTCLIVEIEANAKVTFRKFRGRRR